MTPNPFADAQAWYDRAQHHIAEYRQLANGEGQNAWSLHHSRRSKDVFVYSIKFNRAWLPPLKPVACEAACALFQALDNIIGVAARDANVKRAMPIKWPFQLEDASIANMPEAKQPLIEDDLSKMRDRGLPEVWLELIRETFALHGTCLVAIDVVKEVSLSGKHWELIPTGADAIAIGWRVPGEKQQRFADIPPGYFSDRDEFIFHDGQEIIADNFMIVAGTRLVTEKLTYQPEPISAFQTASRFVATALEKAHVLWKATHD